MGVIYILTSPSGKRYIGQATNFEKRMKTHRYNINDKKCCNYAIYRGIRKYGWENFKKEIVLICNEEHLDMYEKKFISIYDTYRNGYNMTIGGNGRNGHNHSEKSKRKMRLAHLKRKRYGSVTKRENGSYMARVKIDRRDHYIGHYSSASQAKEACLMYQEDHLLMGAL